MAFDLFYSDILVKLADGDRVAIESIKPLDVSDRIPQQHRSHHA